MKDSNKSVLFICADQWRWDCFGFMKNQNAITPNLDKLASKSSIFKSHFTGIIPCGPSRASSVGTSINKFHCFLASLMVMG